MRTLTITEFLEARIAEDEHHSNRELLWGTTPNWTKAHARVLAECAAKRSLLGEHFLAHWASVPEGCRICRTYNATPDPYPCATLKVLAAVYADHPDYQQEWAL